MSEFLNYIKYNGIFLETVNEISLKLLEDELQIAKDCMEKSGSPVVFCNNDIHVRIWILINFLITFNSRKLEVYRENMQVFNRISKNYSIRKFPIYFPN